MYRFKLFMYGVCNELAFIFSGCAPEEEYYWGLFFIKLGYYSVGKGFPALTLMGIGVCLSYS